MYGSNEREKEEKNNYGSKRQITWWSVWSSFLSFEIKI